MLEKCDDYIYFGLKILRRRKSDLIIPKVLFPCLQGLKLTRDEKEIILNHYLVVSNYPKAFFTDFKKDLYDIDHDQYVEKEHLDHRLRARALFIKHDLQCANVKDLFETITNLEQQLKESNKKLEETQNVLKKREEVLLESQRTFEKQNEDLKRLEGVFKDMFLNKK